MKSATPSTTFQWEPLLKQWWFLINTSALAKGRTYFYRITLKEGITIEFSYLIR